MFIVENKLSLPKVKRKAPIWWWQVLWMHLRSSSCFLLQEQTHREIDNPYALGLEWGLVNLHQLLSVIFIILPVVMHHRLSQIMNQIYDTTTPLPYPMPRCRREAAQECCQGTQNNHRQRRVSYGEPGTTQIELLPCGWRGWRWVRIRQNSYYH
jgi:hypothetical protein